MTQPLFTGVGVALVTLFNADLSVDVGATADLAVGLVELGVRSVLVAGTTGEAMALDGAERSALVTAVRSALAGRSDIPVIAGTGSPSGFQAAKLTREAVDAGADAVLVLPPHGTVQLGRYYETARAASGDVPLLAYHFPAVSAPGIPVAVLRDLPVAGCKDSSGDPDRLLETVTTWDRPLYTGSSALLTMAGAVGCAGAILALANSLPETCIRAFAGEADAQRDLTPQHLAAKAEFRTGVKRQVAERFGLSPLARMG